MGPEHGGAVRRRDDEQEQVRTGQSPVREVSAVGEETGKEERYVVMVWKTNSWVLISKMQVSGIHKSFNGCIRSLKQQT